MFERVLETVLEKALGEFVQDIDGKDLKLAVWSGNVVLKNLRLKTEALAKLDLPVFVYAGLIGSLELQVPWKALWTAPTKVCVNDLVLLVIPKDAAPYNEEKAKMEERQRKRNMLDAVEEAQQRIKRKAISSNKDEKQTWAESLITAIIKNLEIKVKNIHIRYEDPQSGYAIGVTLDELFATTTNERWQPTVLGNSDISRIYKLASVVNFAVYWNNPASQLFKLPQQEIERELLQLIVTAQRPNTHHKFVIHPMGCVVKTIINPSNKFMMDTPKATLSIHFTSLITEVRKAQYLDTMLLIDHMERGKKKVAFAQWHPGVPIIGNSRAWWSYLFRYCNETRVKRKVISWRWTSIKEHRIRCREYISLRVKEISGKPTLNELSRISELFDILDIVNITICEQNARIESEKVAASSWLSGWWGGGTQKQESSVADKFGLTSAEKDTLYGAIELSEAAASSQIYPEHYVKFRVKLDLDKVSFKLNDDYQLVAEAAVQGITSEVGIVPHGNGLHLHYKIDTVYVVSEKTSILAPTDKQSIVPICEGEVRINPSEIPADIAIISKFSSVTLIFDMNLFNSISDFTKTEKDLTDFDELRKNIYYYSDQLKSQGKSGMLYAIEKRKVLDITMTLSAPKVVIPESGSLDKKGPVIVADLGRLLLTTQVGVTRSANELLAMSLAELEETAYDNYLLNLENFHLKMFANHEWENDCSLESFVIRPIKLDVSVANSILPDDKNIPKMKCKGHLDAVQIMMSDKKLHDLFRILDSLPKSEPTNSSAPPAQSDALDMQDIWVDVKRIADVTNVACRLSERSADSLPRTESCVSPVSAVSVVSTESEDFFDAPDHFIGTEDKHITQNEAIELISQTILTADFTLNRIVLRVIKEGNYEGKVVLKTHIKNISATLIKTTWMQKIEASLGEIELLDCFTAETPIRLVSSPTNGTLISVAAQMNDPLSPYFVSDFKSTEIAVLGTFDKLDVHLHIDAFLNIYEFGMSLLPKAKEEEIPVEELDWKDSEKTSSVNSIGSIPENMIKVHASAIVNSITLTLGGATKDFAEIAVTNCTAEVIMKHTTTEVVSSLKSLEVSQLSTVGNFTNLLNVESDKFNDLISFKMVQYTKKFDKLDPDMEISMKMGSLHFIFLNFFVQNLLLVLDTFSNARDKMLSASIETAKLAQESSTSSLILLSLEVESPVVKIPRSSSSSEGFKVKLGNITLKNSFKLTDRGTVQDQISIQISHVALSRVILANDGSVVVERGIIEPLEMDLTVMRCLENKSPIELTTNLKQITAHLGHADYHLLLKTLEDNFAETGDREAPPEEPSPGIDTGLSAIDNGVEVDGIGVEIDGDGDGGGGGDIKVKMKIDEAVCHLYTDEKVLDGAGEREDKNMMLYSETRRITVDVTLFADGRKSLQIDVWDVRVEDTDPVIMENGIQRILAHKLLADEEATLITSLEGQSSAIPTRRSISLDIPKAMLNANVEMSKSGDMVVKAKALDTHCVVSWGFINNIITFFTVSPYQADLADTLTETLTDTLSIIGEEETGVKSNNVTFQVTLAVENPEVVFLSNHRNYKTQALLLRTGMEIRLTQRGEQTSIQVSIDRIMMFICQYLYRLSSIYLLLQPCNIVATYSKMEGEKESVYLNISDLIFNISPETLNVMVVVSSQFSSGETVSAAKKEHTAYAYNMWNIETIDQHNRWYIRQATTNLIQENVKLLLSRNTDADLFAENKHRGSQNIVQTLVFSMERFQITLEADYEPLVIITGKTTCTVKDWGGAMLVDVDLSLESSYYSYSLGTYEPILEPVELGNGQSRMWNMSCTVNKCPVKVSSQAAQLMQILSAESASESGDTASQSSLDSMDVLDNAPPVFDIHITSNDKLMLTVTSSALKNLTVLSEAWSLVSDDMQIMPKSMSPLMIQNFCGVSIAVRGKQAPGQRPPPEFSLEHGEKQTLNLEKGGLTRSKDRRRITPGPSEMPSEITDTASINVKIEGYEEIADIQIVQAGLYIYGLVPVAVPPKRERRLGRQLTRSALGQKLVETDEISQQVPKNVLVEVTVVRTSKTITIRSPLHFENLHRVPVRLWYSAPKDTNDSELVRKIGPGEKYYVPLDASICGSTDSHHFHVSPDDDNFRPSLPSLSTTELRRDTYSLVTSTADGGVTSHLAARHTVLWMKPLNVRNPTSVSLQNALYHTIHISPSVMITNKLPVNLRISGIGFTSTEIMPGSREHFDLIDPQSEPTITLRINNYNELGYDWSGELSIQLKNFQESTDQSVTMTTSVGGVCNKITLGVLAKIEDGLSLTVYSTFWLVNCTGKPLIYQGLNDASEILDPASEKQQPMFFSFVHADKSKQKLRMKVDTAGWSDYFSIDTVGSSGSIKSYDEKENFYYEVGVTITLSNIQLTNIVTFYPRFQVINELQSPISVSGGSEMMECLSDKVTPFWPGSKEGHGIVIKIKDGEPSMSIPLEITQQTVIRAEYPGADEVEYTSLVVFVDVRQATTEIRVGAYYLGAAPVRVENLLSASTICFLQLGGMSAVTLPPNTSVLYTWDFPGKKREMNWYVQGDAKKQERANFVKDNCATFVYNDHSTQRPRKGQVVSFLDGLQRVLLFTDDPNIADSVGQEVIKIEQPLMVVEISFPQSIGISLVDGIPQEVTYMQLDSSGAIWERRLKHRNRYKYLSNKLSEELEQAFNSEKDIVEFDEHSFDMSYAEEMRLTFPNQTHATVRRTYLPAMWFQYTLSESQTNMHFKINRIQIDNQLQDHAFRHVFHPIKPPAHAVAAQPPKPLVEFCVIKQSTAVEGETEQSILDHYKYVRMLIQEFHIKLDAGYLLSLINFFKIDETDVKDLEKQDLQWLEEDLKFARTTLNDRDAFDNASSPVFFDEFHLSPLKIHISFSPEVNIDTSQVAVREDTLVLYLRSFGLGLATINDAVLKLAYYDAAGQLCTIPQLQDRVIKHYIHQSLTQLYAVVFGLDILGNPYGLAQDIKAGTMDLFYEPYVGIVQGPREFVEGVIIGVNSFLRHSVGGVVGAASKISRTLGKGLAKLTFDEDYQKQRARRMAQKPGHIGEGLARGGKSFLMGLYHGVTGVVMKPVEGAAQEGVEGFFKGVGKGLVGAVTRPLGGINDMITYTIDGIHHHTQIEEKVLVLRHPRYIQPDKILRPYNTTQSEGMYLLGQIARNTHWKDMYYHHCLLSTKSAFILTDVRCIMSQYDEVMNSWKVEWSHVYTDVEKIPLVLDDCVGIVFSAFMDPNQGMSKFFKNRRKKTRIVVCPTSEETKDMLDKFRFRLYKTNKKRFADDEERRKCWDKCCRCL